MGPQQLMVGWKDGSTELELYDPEELIWINLNRYTEEK